MAISPTRPSSSLSGPNTNNQPPRPSTQAKHSKSSTLPLHRRILYPPPQHPPRILHSTHHSILDPLILDLIALISREYIQSWYSRISPDPDRHFIQQVAGILIHLIQALEVRIAHLDLVELVALDLPALLERHLTDWDQASDKAGTGHAHNYTTEEVFHRLQPHIAVVMVEPSPGGLPEAQVDPTYLRAMVDNLLRLLLPPEDYRAETERTIVREIVVNVIFASVYNKCAQPWFVHSAIAKVLEAGEERRAPEVARKRREASAAAKEPPIAVTPRIVLDKAVGVVAAIPKLLSAVGSSLAALYHTVTSAPIPPQYADQPPLTTPLFSFIKALLPPSPIISQLLHYLQLPLALLSAFTASLTFHLINDKLFTPALAHSLLDTTTRSLFPDGHPPPRASDPTPSEQDEWRRRCEAAVARAVPGSVAQVLVREGVDGEDRSLALAGYLLRGFGSHVANVHLFVLLVDLLVGKLFPEMVVGTED